jgi:hypothetical protein
MGKLAVVVVAKGVKGNTRLFQVVFAPDALGAQLRPAQNRQQQGGEDADDRDDNQQFHQCESAPPATVWQRIHARRENQQKRCQSVFSLKRRMRRPKARELHAVLRELHAPG